MNSSDTNTGAIDRLENAGWTPRARCTADRRKVFVTLTGRSDEAPHTACHRDIETAMVDYTDAQLRTLTEFLNRLADLQASTGGEGIDRAGSRGFGS